MLTRMLASLGLLALLPALALATNVEICKGVWADDAGVVPVGDAIDKCLSALGTTPLKLPSGTYLINQTIKSSGKLATVGLRHGVCLYSETRNELGDPHPCAVLKAAATLNDSVIHAKDLQLSFIVVDGNKAERTSLANSCIHGTAGISVRLTLGGQHFRGNAFINAVCGAAVATTGSGLFFEHNYFYNNGHYDAATLAYADGLQMGVSEGTRIVSNIFRDNTRSGLAIGGGAGLEVVHNLFVQHDADAFAGLTLDALHGPHASQFWGAHVSNNSIAGNGRLAIAMQVGGQPFAKGDAVQGGSCSRNHLDGAALLLNVNDATDWELWGNEFGKTEGSFKACSKPTGQLNISPQSKVKSHGDMPTPTALTYEGCLPPH